LILTADLRMYCHSGIGRYLRNLFPPLLPLLRAEKIRVLASRQAVGAASWLSDPRVEFIESAAPIYSIQEQILGLSVATRALHPGDTLWVPHFNAPLLHRGRMVVTIHDVAPLAMPQILSNGIKRAYARLLIERALSKAVAILCVSEFTRNEIASRLHVPAAKMTVTHPGLDADWPANAPAHLEEDGTPYFLYVGNVKPNKNLGLLLRSFASVQDKLPHRLVLAGQFSDFGTGDSAVLQQAEAMGKRVRFAGVVNDAELQSLYAGAVALVQPSLYEGFGLPLLEAMRLGCPVLCSTAGSLPEVAGNAALYFDPHSVGDLATCLLRVEDAAAMNGLRTLGRTRVGEFSFARCAEQTAEVINRVMEAHP
jgi:glycosyltransferase involved in cell wall biosynthesis